MVFGVRLFWNIPRMRRSLLQELPQILAHHARLPPHLMIPKSLHQNAARRQVTISFLVLGPFVRKPVPATVQFHSQLCFRAIKVQVVGSHRMLPTEFVTGKSPVAQDAP